MTEFSVFMLLQGIAAGITWLGVVYLKDCKTIWKIVMRIKWRGMVEIKYRLYRCRFNYGLSKPIVANELDDLLRR